MSRKILAIDIRHNAISALLIQNTFKGNRIDAFRYIPYEGRAAGSDGAAGDFERAVESLVSEWNIEGAECAISLPPEIISYRNLSVPFTDPRKIRQILPFEIESVLPFPVDELTIDFEKTGRTDPVDIYVAAVRTSDMESVVAALQRCGITPQSIAPGGLPAAVTFAAYGEQTPDFIWIDASTGTITMVAVASSRVHLLRNVQIGHGDPVEKARLLQPHLVQFTAAFEACFHRDFEPAAVLLSGSEVDRETLAALADNILGLAVRPADLLGLSDLNMTLSEPGDYTPAKYNGALGLAAAEINGLHLINFLGERSALKRYWEEYKNNILTSGFIAVMVFFLVMFHVLLDAYYLQRSVDRINSQIVATFQTAFPEISRIVDPVQQMRLALQEVREKSTFAVNLEADISNMELLNEMSRSIPAGLDVEITRWVRGDVDIIITGNTDTFQTVDEIKGSLENSSLWQVITIASANMNNTTNRIEFRLKIDL
jgi:general secretion pathway protein L